MLIKAESLLNFKDGDGNPRYKKTIINSIETLGKIADSKIVNKEKIIDNLNVFYRLLSRECLFYRNVDFFATLISFVEEEDGPWIPDDYGGYLLFVYLLLYWFYKYGNGSKVFKENLRRKILEIQKIHKDNNDFVAVDFKTTYDRNKLTIDEDIRKAISNIIIALNVARFEEENLEAIFLSVQRHKSNIHIINECFDSNFIIENILLLVAHLGIDLSKNFIESETTKLKKFSKNLRQIKPFMVTETINLNYRELLYGIDLFNFYDVSCNIYWEDSIEKVVNDRNAIVTKIKNN